MHLPRRRLLGAAALICAGCGGGGMPAPVGLPPVPAEATATYRLVLRGQWTAAKFSTRFPPTAHLTGVVGAVHGDKVSFWKLGQNATLGVKNVAEMGSKPVMLDEVSAAIAAGTAYAALSGEGIPLGGTEVSLTFTATQQFSQLTLLTMLGPSPDWFTGVSGLPLFQEGAWRSLVTVELDVYDAGTDDGATFNSANLASNPPVGVSLLSTPASDSDFQNGVHRSSGAHIATLTIERLS